ncbi:MAG: hypothetical protein F9Y92_07535 [Thermoplasmatales archaeon]|nr:hypothetical protein [Thermoplasmatales archaeon]
MFIENSKLNFKPNENWCFLKYTYEIRVKTPNKGLYLKKYQRRDRVKSQIDISFYSKYKGREGR